MTDEVQKANEVVNQVSDKVMPWRDRYLQFVSNHPKTVSVLLAVAVVWAVLATIKV